MAEFTPINSQEEFDAVIKSRLEREANKVRGEFADYNTIKDNLAAKTKETEELNGKISGLESQVKELTLKLSASETDSAKTRIAYEMGIPFELSKRLTGSTEEDIRKDAEGLKQFFNNGKPQQPLFNPEAPAGDSKDAAFRQLVQGLNK